MYETTPQRQVSFHLPPETNGYGEYFQNLKKVLTLHILFIQNHNKNDLFYTDNFFSLYVQNCLRLIYF